MVSMPIVPGFENLFQEWNQALVGKNLLEGA
jgi:hypothetical protein